MLIPILVPILCEVRKDIILLANEQWKMPRAMKRSDTPEEIIFEYERIIKPVDDTAQ